MPVDRTSDHWARYYDALEGGPARDTLVQAADAFDLEGVRQRSAIDLGCGDGRDSLELLRRGWSVTAIDITAAGLERLVRRAGPDARLVTIEAAMEDARWTAVDLVNASLALPFCAPGRFGGLWERIVASLPSGGRFAGHVFGPRLSWADEVVTHTREDALALFTGFELERFDEKEHDGVGPTGRPQHTHAFFIVARKR